MSAYNISVNFEPSQINVFQLEMINFPHVIMQVVMTKCINYHIPLAKSAWLWIYVVGLITEFFNFDIF